jgi:hypothetical protein
MVQNGLLRVQFDVSRDRLEDEARRVRRAVKAANGDYPERYNTEALARSEEVSRRVAKDQQQLDEDEAVLDRVMQESD